MLTHRTVRAFVSLLTLIPLLFASAATPLASAAGVYEITRGTVAFELWMLAGAPTGPFPPSGFPDVTANTTYRTAIEWAAAAGVTIGRDDGTFGPDAPVSRGAFATMLYRVAGSPPGPYPPAPYGDVKPSATHTTAINWLATTGITVGQNHGNFGPYKPVTRTQLAGFVTRFRTTPGVSVAIPHVAVNQDTAPQAPLAPFRLATNGVTIICPDAAIGDDGEVNGVTYTKRARADITVANAATTCTSGITDLSGLFAWDGLGGGNFNGDISHWDTSSVIDMSGMFEWADRFNQPIGSWDTSNVTNMRGMFEGAQAFNRPLEDWDTSNVVNMRDMFFYATLFNQPIGSWDTSHVTDMSGMFFVAEQFNQDISGWNTSSVTNMDSMFSLAAPFNGDISSWNTSNVTNMAFMFSSAPQFNQPIGRWSTANVTDMSNMFTGATSFNQPLATWNTTHVTNMTRMFEDASAFNQNLSSWCVAQLGSEPQNFALGATAWVQAKPVWGTCPA